MKICYLASANSIHSKRWIDYFAQKGHDIYWISLAKNEFGKIERVKFYQLKEYWQKPLDILLNFYPLKRILKKIKPDIFHAHYAGVNGVLGALSGFHPFVLTVWGSDILIAGKSKISKPFINFALKKSDLITCNAEHIKEAIIKLEIPPSKIKIIYFGVDTQKFSPGEKDGKLIQELNLHNSPIIISLRNLEPIYNLETLIKAIPLVLREFPKSKFIIAGKGSEEEDLKKLAKDLRILENVKFVGHIFHDELPRYLTTADVYVSTSLSDTTSVSLLEAMACGLAPVVTDVGENRKILDRDNGFVVPVKNPPLLAEKVIYLLKNKEIREKIGKINREIIKENYDHFKEMEKMENIYKNLIKT